MLTITTIAIQPPRVPALPQPTRRLILIAGLVVSMLLSIGSILMTHFFRAIYLRPEALEMEEQRPLAEEMVRAATRTVPTTVMVRKASPTELVPEWGLPEPGLA